MPQQASRLLTMLVLLVGGLFTARYFLVPETFGTKGHYRAAAIDSVMVLPIRYAGEQACAECHDDIYDDKKDSRHGGVSCEVCHGPAVVHVDDPDEYQPPAPRQRAYCPLCHGYNAARPTGFPQVEPPRHNPGKPCIECHDPHQPEPPHVPEECSACHAQIANTKAISPHESLACVHCHEVEELHKVEPRRALPSKPQSREFCGSCHTRGSEAPKTVPRISLASHEPGYVCWQCHYPHHPEAER